MKRFTIFFINFKIFSLISSVLLSIISDLNFTNLCRSVFWLVKKNNRICVRTNFITTKEFQFIKNGFWIFPKFDIDLDLSKGRVRFQCNHLVSMVSNLFVINDTPIKFSCNVCLWQAFLFGQVSPKSTLVTLP